MTTFLVWLILQQPISRPATHEELSGVGFINPEWEILTVPSQIHIAKPQWSCRETETEWICEPKEGSR